MTTGARSFTESRPPPVFSLDAGRAKEACPGRHQQRAFDPQTLAALRAAGRVLYLTRTDPLGGADRGQWRGLRILEGPGVDPGSVHLVVWGAPSTPAGRGYGRVTRLPPTPNTSSLMAQLARFAPLVRELARQLAPGRVHGPPPAAWPAGS